MIVEPYIGEIRSVGFDFAPQGWASCDGQLLSIAENSALFSLLGTTYGGDGRTTFALPDLRSRAAIDAGQGPGLPPVQQGQKLGGETVKVHVGSTGGGQPVYIAQPSLGLNYIIALQGAFPARDG